jgi:hypothetical protein
VWFLVNDRVKLLAYRIFDSPKAAAAAKAKGIAVRAKVAAKAETKPAAKPDANPAPAPVAATPAKPDEKPAPEPQAMPSKTRDLTPQLVQRVHELYEELGREEVLAVQELEREQNNAKPKVAP